jgi:hypothetical protein
MSIKSREVTKLWYNMLLDSICIDTQQRSLLT